MKEALEILYQLGEVLLYDDIADIGKMDRLHHCYIGIILMLGTLLGYTTIELLELAQELFSEAPSSSQSQ